jgi:hypothetical protein
MARMRKDRMPAQYRAALHKLFEASNTQSVEEGCTDWIKTILEGDDEGWAKLRKSFVELYEAKIMAGSPMMRVMGYSTLCRRLFSMEPDRSRSASVSESIRI